MTTHPPHHPTQSFDPDPDPDRAADTSTKAGTETGQDVTGAAFDRDGDARPLVDLVAGDPPVPITVWRTARAGGDRGASIPARLARRLVAAYSRPAEAVVDLTDDHALTTACRAGDRRHHRAWFTDVASLIIGPATTGGDVSGGADADVGVDTDDGVDTDRSPLHRGARPGRAVRTDPDRDSRPDGGSDTDDAEPVWSLADWFGDDLTDPHLPPAAPPVVPVPDGASLTGLTSLVVASWPLDPDPAAGRVRLAWLLTACRELLRPGGCLVLVVALPPGHPAAGRGVTPEDFSPIVAAAARAGLGYLQHIVAVAADISGEHGDTFIYHLDSQVADEELLALSRAGAQADGEIWTVAHLRVHADLLVFTPVQFPASPRRRRGAGREGGGRRG